MDDTADVRVRGKFPYTEILAVAGEANGNGLDFCCCACSAHILQLASDLETRVGIGRSGRYSQHVVVAHCRVAISLHFLYQMRW